MGGFILYNKVFETTFDIQVGIQCFIEKGFKKHKQYTLNDYVLISFSKQLVQNENIWEDNARNKIFVFGTLIYRGNDYTNSKSEFLSDIVNQHVDLAKLKGTFSAFIDLKGKIFFITDALNQYKIYYIEGKNVICSSFLALLSLYREKFRLNKSILFENLTTGCIWGDETILKQIKTFHYLLTEKFVDNVIVLKNTKIAPPNFEQKSFRTGIDNSLGQLKTALLEVANYVSHYKVDLGLSGGFDSRLLLVLCIKYFNSMNLSIHSNWKRKPDSDLEIARTIAQRTGLNYREIPVLEYFEMSPSQLLENIHHAMLFYDGQIRVNHSWIHEYRTSNYRKKILGSSKFGMSGLGGEQFRNSYSYAFDRVDKRKFISSHVIGAFNIDCIIQQNLITKLADRIIDRAQHILDIDIEKKKLSFLEIQRFYSELWVIFGPGIRDHIENQISFYYSPFINDKLYHCSYSNHKLLGIDGKLEAALIKTINHDIASIETNYGKNFNTLSKSHILKLYLKNFATQKIKLWIKEKEYFNQYEQRIVRFKLHSKIKNLINIFKDIGLSINVDKFIINEINFSHVLSIAYLLQTFSHKIDLNE